MDKANPPVPEAVPSYCSWPVNRKPCALVIAAFTQSAMSPIIDVNDCLRDVSHGLSPMAMLSRAGSRRRVLDLEAGGGPPQKLEDIIAVPGFGQPYFAAPGVMGRVGRS